MKLSEQQMERYSRQIILPEIGGRGQAPALERATRDPDVDVQEMARFALEVFERRAAGNDTPR